MSQHPPQRPGEPCRDYLRTGRCKYGDSCKYHHPAGGIQTNDPNEPPFPIRPDEPVCQYFLKNGTCKFAQACKFNHPPHMMGKPRSAYAGGAVVGPTNSNLGLQNDNSMPGDEGLVLPQRINEPDCIYFLKHGRCKYGGTCKYHHPLNAHAIGADSTTGIYLSQPMYRPSSERDRSTSGGSQAELRENPGSNMRGSSMNPHMYQTYDQGRRVVDSVPQRPRGVSLDTISQSYQYQGQHSNGHSNGNGHNNTEWQRYYKHTSQDDSPNHGSPSITSSTLASSYETAVSNIERLPQAMAQNQSANIRKSLSNHSTEDTMLTFDSAMMPPSHEGARISGVRHYGLQAAHANHTIPRQRREDMYDPNGRFPYPDNRKTPVDNYNEQLILRRQKQEDDATHATHRKDTRDNNFPGRNVDDGLSMMTSALLTMLDTPGNNEKGDAGTISSHSSNYDDAIVPMNDPSYISRPNSLPEYSTPSRPINFSSNRNRMDQNGNVSRVIGSHPNAYSSYDNNSNGIGFFNHFQSQPQHLQHQNIHSSEHYPNIRNDSNPSYRYNGMGHVNAMSNMNMNAHHHPSQSQRAIAPGGKNPEAVAEIQRGQWNPNSDTVGSVPTQFFLAS
jgi:hypothetical protein